MGDREIKLIFDIIKIYIFSILMNVFVTILLDAISDFYTQIHYLRIYFNNVNGNGGPL